MSWTETTNETKTDTLIKKSILESKSVEGRYQGHFLKRKGEDLRSFACFQKAIKMRSRGLAF